jgi:23S rRNA-/tRNA-specific pseudouridylate synthase
LISHQIHRHEPPVIAHPPIQIVHSCPELLVVNKPGGVPVHPSGNYFHNSVTRILEEEGWEGEPCDPVTNAPKRTLFRKPPCSHSHVAANRIDRLTSGLLLIALNKQKAQQLMDEFMKRTIKKTYVCRVKGEFPR